MKREEAFTLGSETAVANFDFDEERTEGKAVAVAMPQLMSVFEAIPRI